MATTTARNEMAQRMNKLRTGHERQFDSITPVLSISPLMHGIEGFEVTDLA
jgi:hypothetical protein